MGRANKKSWGEAGVDYWEGADAECRRAESVEFWEGAGQKAGRGKQNPKEGQPGIPGGGGAGAQDRLRRGGGAAEGVGPVTSASPNGQKEARGRGYGSGISEPLRSVPREQSAAGTGREPEPLRHLLAHPTDRRTQSGPQAPARAPNGPGRSPPAVDIVTDPAAAAVAAAAAPRNR